MTIVYADEFSKQLYKLPSDIQRIYRKEEKIFRENWRDPRLHVKKIRGEPVIYSFRVTRAYRVLFLFVEPGTTLMATVGHRKDIYRK